MNPNVMWVRVFTPLNIVDHKNASKRLSLSSFWVELSVYHRFAFFIGQSDGTFVESIKFQTSIVYADHYMVHGRER